MLRKQFNPLLINQLNTHPQKEGNIIPLANPGGILANFLQPCVYVE